jgi:type I restriction enzyme S subunit
MKKGQGYYFLTLFTYAWEQRKLGELAEIVGGGTPSTSNPEYWNGDIDWYSPTEIGEKIYADGSVKTITKLGYEKSSAKLLPANKTILFTSRAGIGSMAILRRSGTTNQGFQSLVLNDDYDTYFMYSSGHKIKEYAMKNASGSTFLEISGKQLGNMDFLIPSYEEQKVIGAFFTNLDNLITLHQREP